MQHSYYMTLLVFCYLTASNYKTDCCSGLLKIGTVFCMLVFPQESRVVNVSPLSLIEIYKMWLVVTFDGVYLPSCTNIHSFCCSFGI